MDEEVLGWHFLPSDRRLRRGRRNVVEVGQTTRVSCQPVLCKKGLHASIRAIDALSYAPGPIVCRVTVGGVIVTGSDKLAGTVRKVLAMADATVAISEWACDCVEAVLPLFEKEISNDSRPRLAIETKRRWLRGEATGAELDAAVDAALDAAVDAALDAARAASRDAARDAALDAARDAARAAAWAAARGATWAAARASARDAAWAAARDVAQAAAWAAARDVAQAAAWAAARASARQNQALERRLLGLMGLSE